MKALNPNTGTYDTIYVKALDTMPVGAEIDFDGDATDIPTGWELVGNNYSTDEIKTGKTWIDNKPIYKRVYTGTLPSGADVLFTISNLDSLVDIKGKLEGSGYTYIIGNYVTQNYNSGFQYQSSTGCQVFHTSGLTGYAYTITVEYTKTTD